PDLTESKNQSCGVRRGALLSDQPENFSRFLYGSLIRQLHPFSPTGLCCPSPHAADSFNDERNPPPSSGTLERKCEAHSTDYGRQLTRLAFPHVHYFPSLLCENRFIPRIAYLVTPELGEPELTVRLRRIGVLAPRVSVPEAAMHKDCNVVLGKDNIWSARQV